MRKWGLSSLDASLVGAFLPLGGCTTDPTKATACTWKPCQGFSGVFEAQGDTQPLRQAPTCRGRCLFHRSSGCQRGRAELGLRPSGQAGLQHAALCEIRTGPRSRLLPSPNHRRG